MNEARHLVDATIFILPQTPFSAKTAYNTTHTHTQQNSHLCADTGELTPVLAGIKY